MRIRELAGRPIEQYTSPNIGGTMTDHRGLVLHSAEGTYRGTIAWQLNPDQEYGDGTKVTTSSTFIVGRRDGEWAQMVDSDRVAWCQRSGSYTWMSIELAGFAPSAPTPWQVWACAQLLVWAHETYRVPYLSTTNTSGRGLGHHSMDNDTSVQWGHDACPGAGVIGAKPAIVRLADGMEEDEDVTPEQEQMLKDIKHVVITNGKTRDGQWFTPGLETAINGARGQLSQLQTLLTEVAARPSTTVDVEALAEALAPKLSMGPLTYEQIRAACEDAVRIVAADAGTP